jgi:hypothetical protein
LNRMMKHGLANIKFKWAFKKLEWYLLTRFITLRTVTSETGL